MPSSPLSTASRASSAVIRPLSTSRVFTVSRSRLINSRVRLVAPVEMMPEMSRPSKLGLRCTKLASPNAWQDPQVRVSVRHSRTKVSQF